MRHISIGLVSDSLLALREIKGFPCHDLESLRMVHTSHGVNIDSIISFISQCGWLSKIDQSQCILTDAGLEIVSLFDNLDISENLWRKILESYIMICTPAWASRIPSGREEAYIFMAPDEKRCFLEAGLMANPPNQEVVKWWDNLAEDIRKAHNIKLEETGREGEKLTVDYEIQRTGKVPIWKSIDTNLVGYDIISTVDQFSDTLLLIEVKSSRKPLSSATMIISRHEWEVATLTPSTSMYMFYVWRLGEAKILAKLSVEDIAPHVPSEKGDGYWKDVEIPYISFAGKFIEV